MLMLYILHLEILISLVVHLVDCFLWYIIWVLVQLEGGLVELSTLITQRYYLL